MTSGNIENYSYESTELPKEGDSRTWLYRITKLKTGNMFGFIVQIVGSALASPGEIVEIQDAVNTNGESLVKGLLGAKKEVWMFIKIGTKSIFKEEIREEGKYAYLIS